MKVDPVLIARAITDGKPALLSLKVLRALRLAPWAHQVLAVGCTAEKELKIATAPDFAVTWQRYLQRKQVLSILLMGLEEHGVKVLIFKGMALASTVYPSPASRFAGDVDIMIDPAHLQTLFQVAGRLFPECTYRSIAALVGSKALGQLSVPSMQCTLDIHSGVANPKYSLTDVGPLTTQAWAAAVETQVFGSPAYLLSPVDSILFGLALNRGWSLDGWVAKPYDYLDQQHLVDQFGLTSAKLADRAAQLGISRSWRAYSANCNVFEKTLHLATDRAPWKPPSSQFLPSRPPPSWLAKLFFPMRAVALLREVVAVLPHLLAALWVLAKEGDPSRLLMPKRKRRFFHLSLSRIVRGVFVVRSLLSSAYRFHRAGSCVITSTTLYRTLVTNGHAAELIIGFRRDEEQELVGHAWVEVDGQPVRGMGDDVAKRLYVETVRVG